MARARTPLLALTACLAAIATGAPPATAAGACANASLTPAPGNAETVRAAIVCLIDRERARHGEDPLRLNAHLAGAAQQHSREMADADFFSHVSPDGQTPLDRMRANGYAANPADGYVVGENIAWGTLWLATPQAIVEAWMASPGHRANILDGAFRETGVGVEPHPPASFAEGQPGALYTQDFGTALPAGHAARRSAAGSALGRPAHRRHRHRHHRRKHRVHRRRKHSRRRP